MEFKMVVSDPESGKSYQREIKEDAAIRLRNLGVGDEFDGTIIGLDGYKLIITGGSDKCGFPMRKGVHGAVRPMVLMDKGVGYNPQRKIRRRKRVRGEKLDEDIVQVNTKITKKGSKSIEDAFGIAKEAAEGKTEKKE